MAGRHGGTLLAADRRDSNYRDYGDADLHRLGFIRRARDLGFAVEDIGRLLELWRDGGRSSADVKRLAEQHIAALEEKIAGLQSMQRTLERLACACHGDDRPDCPILDDLAVGARGGIPARPGRPLTFLR